MDMKLLRQQLASQPAEEAVTAGLDHLGQFDQLLGSLIGNTLKDQLLAPAWATETADAPEAPVTDQAPASPAIRPTAGSAPRR